MKATKEHRIRKALKTLNFAMEILNSNYVPHFTEPSLDDLNKSFKFIEQELEQMIERNFGKIKKN